MSEAGKAAKDGKPLKGVLPVFQTPFNDDESIDFAALAREVGWLYEQGVDGLVLAMVSEVLRLSEQERRAVAEQVCKESRGRGVVIISVGAESTRTACELARHAESVGADGVMAIPPVSVGVGESELRKYYEAIFNAIRIPLIVQDASGYVGKPMSIELQASMLNDLGDRVRFKPEAPPLGPRVTALNDATHGRAQIFEGSGGIALVESYRRGIVGTMPGADLIKGVVALWRALEAGDEQRIYELHLPIASLVSMQGSLDAFLAVEKHLLVKQGVFPNQIVRGPVAYHMDDTTRAEVDRLFDRMMQAIEAVGAKR